MVAVSLGMTSFNRGRYLPSAIESVIGQSWTDWELHIVDDHSTDNSSSIASDYAAADDRIHVYQQKPNRGFGQTLHCAMAQCKGQYVGWVDSDDQLTTDAIAAMVDALQSNPGSELAYSDYVCIDSEGHPGRIGSRCVIPYSADRLLVEFMSFHFRLMTRNLYESIGGVDPDYGSAVDYDLCLKASERTEILHVPQVLYRYRQHSESISRTDRAVLDDCAHRAVQSALSRRGMSDTHQIRVDTRFVLERR